MITEWLTGNGELAASQYGNVSNREWLTLEAERLNNGGGSYGKYPVWLKERKSRSAHNGIELCLRND